MKNFPFIRNLIIEQNWHVAASRQVHVTELKLKLTANVDKYCPTKPYLRKEGINYVVTNATKL